MSSSVTLKFLNSYGIKLKIFTTVIGDNSGKYNYELSINPTQLSSSSLSVNGNLEVVYQVDGSTNYGIFQIIDTSILIPGNTYEINLLNQKATTVKMSSDLTLGYLNNSIPSSSINTCNSSTGYGNNNGWVTVGSLKYGCVLVYNSNVIGNINFSNNITGVSSTLYIGAYDTNMKQITSLSKTLYLLNNSVPFLLNENCYLQLVLYFIYKNNSYYVLYPLIDLTNYDLNQILNISFTSSTTSTYKIIPTDSNLTLSYFYNVTNYVTPGVCSNSYYYTIGSPDAPLCIDNIKILKDAFGIDFNGGDGGNNGGDGGNNGGDGGDGGNNGGDTDNGSSDSNFNWVNIIIIIAIIIIIIIVIVALFFVFKRLGNKE